MTCDFTSFSTVFQSYQDDGRLIMKGCVQWRRKALNYEYSFDRDVHLLRNCIPS